MAPKIIVDAHPADRAWRLSIVGRYEVGVSIERTPVSTEGIVAVVGSASLLQHVDDRVLLGALPSQLHEE
jgi:hypothetical protein